MVLAWLVGQLGFTSCNGVINGGMECMYGMPTADYDISVSVIDAAGKAQAGQKVIVRNTDKSGNVNGYQGYNHADTLVTDAEGKIQQHSRDFPVDGMRFVVQEPVDKTLAPDSINVTPKQTKKGDGSWYDGTFEVKGEIVLKKIVNSSIRYFVNSSAHRP